MKLLEMRLYQYVIKLYHTLFQTAYLQILLTSYNSENKKHKKRRKNPPFCVLGKQFLFFQIAQEVRTP